MRQRENREKRQIKTDCNFMGCMDKMLINREK